MHGGNAKRGSRRLVRPCVTIDLQLQIRNVGTSQPTATHGPKQETRYKIHGETKPPPRPLRNRRASPV